MHLFVRVRLLYWRDASLNRLHCCIGGYIGFVLEGCISLYVRLLYWRDASCSMLLYWKDAYLNVLDFCTKGVRLLY